MSYLPLADYGVIGDMHSIALVGKNGSIDWCCLPQFDSPSVFGAILDSRKGGFFRLAPVEACDGRQMYLPDTNVLMTHFFCEEGMVELIDFMPIGRESGGETTQSARQIVRVARAILGPLRLRMECRPAFDYARRPHKVHLLEGGRAAVFEAPGQSFVLRSERPLILDGDSAVEEFSLNGGEHAAFSLRYGCPPEDSLPSQEVEDEKLLTETVRFWRRWSGRSQYHGRWREFVNRSALVLKLMTFRPSGAIIAAPTTSLPESIGGARNWDYRYTWVRDAAFTVYALMRLGYTEEAGAFAHFIQERAKDYDTENGPLNVLYPINGRKLGGEETLDHLEGYRGSRPVRIGNAAAGHLQLDIYGELMDSIYLYDKYGTPLSYDMWTSIEGLLDWLCSNWRQPDQSIWEVRGGRREFTYSKVQSWVALDRGIRLARKRSFPSEGDRWLKERNEIYRSIMSDGWNESERSFTQFFGSGAADASLLLMPLMLFVSPSDPRMTETLDRIRERLAADSLVRRYDPGVAAPDGLAGGEGYFSVCSFWLVEAMARAGRVEEAQLMFDKTLSYANHLGLFSEEIGARGELLGNFPQALTHLALISAAHNLNLLLDRKG